MENITKTRRQIAIEYGVCPRTLNNMLLNEAVILPSGLISPKYQEIIHQKLGNPKKDDNKDLCYVK
jgi:hypothetical protein